MINVRDLRPVHPFPARMAASIPLEKLTGANRRLTLVDPMSGSGTTVYMARALGHKAVGFDTDPLSRVIANVWCGDLDEPKLRAAATRVCARAEKVWRSLPASRAYPLGADEETRRFARYWFDLTNRKQLRALSESIADETEQEVAEQLWCALSRLIIVKQRGASLAMDVAHSRPHRVYRVAPIRPLDKLLASVEYIIRAKSGRRFTGTHRIETADARRLPMRARSADLVITSPPYLNAIDYLRGHKLSLVWMGRTIEEIRILRATSIGAEVGMCPQAEHVAILKKVIHAH